MGTSRATYGVMLLSVIAAAAIRSLLHPFLEEDLPFSFFYLAVAFAGWWGGIWPSMIAAILSVLVANYLFTLPNRSLAIASVQEGVSLVVFLVVSFLIGVLAENARRAAQRSNASREKLQQLADAMPQIVWSTETTGSVNYYNRKWTEFTGVIPNKGMDAGWQAVIHPEDRQRTVAAWQQAVETGSTYEIEHRIRREDGTYRWMLSRAIPARDENERIIQWYGSSTDIDEYRQIREALQEADRHKDEFLAVLAHELRNPLAAIQYAVEVARLTAASGSEETTELIDHQVKHLAHLIDDLLDVSRISRGKITLKQEQVDAATVVRNAVGTARPLIDTRRHELIVEISDKPMGVWGDPTRLEQVLVNLLTNAAKYTPDEGRIVVSAAPEGDQAVFRVRDNGIGIPPEVLPHVFELFSQVDKSLDRSHGGLGIGLSVVRGLVEMHRGSISAASAGLGKGSEFIVRLPLSTRTDFVSRVESPHVLAVGPHVRVLLVEDNAAAASMLRALLAARGHIVEVAHSGTAGVELAAEFSPDVVVLDIGLPGMDGYEVARRLRENEATRGAIIVGLSGYAQQQDRERARAAGFDHHLVKPCALGELLPLLELKAAQS